MKSEYLPGNRNSCLLAGLNQCRTGCIARQHWLFPGSLHVIPSIETCLPSKGKVSHEFKHLPVDQCAVPTVSWTSACLLPEVANVREALLHRLPVCRAERVNVCRSIVSSRLARKKRKKRDCRKRAAMTSIS
jgi:hypothetical protein